MKAGDSLTINGERWTAIKRRYSVAKKAYVWVVKSADGGTKEVPEQVSDDRLVVAALSKATILKGDKGDKGDPGKDAEQVDVQKIVDEVYSQILKIVPTVKDGKDGYTPKAGKDYPTKEMVQSWVLSEVAKINAKSGRDGKDGYVPEHKWEGTTLYFKKADGTWDKGVDLKGKDGRNADLIGGGGGSFIGLSKVDTSDTPGTLESKIVAGNNITITKTNGTLSIAGSAGGSGSPGGSDTQVQFNDGGSFGGDAGLTYNKTTNALTSGDVLVDDEAYGVGWNGSTEVPTKNALYDKIETISGGTGITWSEVTGTTQSAATNNAYIANNASQVVITIPTTAAVGSIVRVSGKGAGGWRLAQNASEIIHFGNLDSTTGTGGYIESTHRRDAVEIVCVVADTEWNVISSVGNITVV